MYSEANSPVYFKITNGLLYIIPYLMFRSVVWQLSKSILTLSKLQNNYHLYLGSPFCKMTIIFIF